MLMEKKRLFFLDNLKALLILLVVMHHAGQAYGPTGGYWDIQDASRFTPLGSFFSVNASFFMALFFFVSAYFLPQAFDRRGPARFLKDRLVKLGIPVLLGVLVIVPLYQFFSYNHYRGKEHLTFLDYYIKVFFGIGGQPNSLYRPNWPELNFGPYWFILHLIVYAVCYTLIRLVCDRISNGKTGSHSALLGKASPGVGGILLFTVVVTLITGIIRTKYDIDHWIGILGFIQAEPAHLAIYASMFTAGIWAYRKNWLDRISSKTGFIFLVLGVIMAIMDYVMRLGTCVPGWLSDNWFMYDTPMGIFLCIGSIAVAREFLNHSGKVWGFLSGNAFTVYLLHVPVLVLIQALLLKMEAGGFVKFLLSSIMTMAVCHTLAFFLRKIKAARTVLG